MNNAVLLFGVVSNLVLNADSWFKSILKDIYAALGIIYWPLAHGNHKGVSSEKYYRFLKKTQEISGQGRGTHEVFLQHKKTYQYACNSSPIDGTNILRSVTAVSR